VYNDSSIIPFDLEATNFSVMGQIEGIGQAQDASQSDDEGTHSRRQLSQTFVLPTRQCTPMITGHSTGGAQFQRRPTEGDRHLPDKPIGLFMMGTITFGYANIVQESRSFQNAPLFLARTKDVVSGQPVIKLER
jgi:hypothetical protein